jgi:Ser/Thr protein kinase RdoA (MazF antagonist)
VSVSYGHNSQELLTPVPEEQLLVWLAEFYGKHVEIGKREVLCHRDLSYVERLWITDGLPDSLIYKLVLPPWDVEQDLHERVLIPSISNSAQLYLSAHRGPLTALFLEDLGTKSLAIAGNAEVAASVGKELAKMHRAYSYRTDELMQTNVLRTILPLDYGQFTGALIGQLVEWGMIDPEAEKKLLNLARSLAAKLAGEPISLVHGDLFAENIIQRGERLFIIDWSWFTALGVPLMDLATLTLEHPKNAGFSRWKQEVIEAYCFESARETGDVRALLPFAERLSKLFFLEWLMERHRLGKTNSTMVPPEEVIPSVVKELADLSELG